ncbi:hypothetical protein PQ469_24500 [Mucilaginibacter sp. KACC 22773]|uniref:hypothetical protein n=1 Tax=Mucilaginibacter sp. KACC 22773 TaxID=3025671 RepID=UPI002366E1E0|nr:hypothetical protein [Mucilaginibacter sp. KACC 22773]WDF77048.1 hypothetical protein PQ469_24500 [Mucilaginibacter sp. KACC 22773]
MKKRTFVLLFVFGFFFSPSLIAQQYVIDYQHLIAVSQNAAVRSSAELTHDQYLGKINNNISDLNTNVGSVVLAQTMIYEGLSNLNSALKDGLAVKNMAVIIADMTAYINQALAMARNEPYLLLFAENIASEMRQRSLALVSDVSGYVLKEGNNVLADYNSRDQLLRKVITQLQILDGLAYGAWKSMYWAKERGVIAALNPFANFISQDNRIVNETIQNAKYLRQ